MFNLTIRTSRKDELVDITPQVKQLVLEHGAIARLCVVYVPHTTAAVTINENADRDVNRDILHGLDNLVPQTGDYRHAEGNSPAHIKASLLGSSATVILNQGRLMLGTWQGIFLAEFDGPRTRTVYVQLA